MIEFIYRINNKEVLELNMIKEQLFKNKKQIIKQNNPVKLHKVINRFQQHLITI